MTNHSNPSYPMVGMEWADDLESDIGSRLDQIDCLELIPENFFRGNRKGFLSRLCELEIPTLVHAVEMSIGTDGPIREDHVNSVIEVAEQVPLVNLSDHLCLTEAGGIEIGQLTPIPWNDRSLDVVCRNVDHIQKKTKAPFLIENITNRFMIPNQKYTETQFINKILEKTGCELLLDVTNVYTNAINFKFDPYQWLEEIRLDRATTIHLAGGHYDHEGVLVDSHSYNVFDEVWDIYRYVCEKIRPPFTVVEWTENTPELDILFGDISKAKQILEETAPAEERINEPAQQRGAL